MDKRNFSDNIKYQVILSNIKKNNGQLKCSLCGKIISESKSEYHFDHILAYSKGGHSTLDNCQILCTKCNLSKSDKDMQNFVLEEKAKSLLTGNDLLSISKQSKISNSKMTKELFDKAVREFIANHGNICKVDFTRDINELPSVTYIYKYYGSINNMKSAFGIEINAMWNRENIWETLVRYSKINPELKQNDLTKDNRLPSLPCILSYYPEYKNFSDIKIALGLSLNYEQWSKDKVVTACKEYLKTHNKITLKDLCKRNGLPTSRVIYKYFGTMQNFQEEIKSELSECREYISKDEILSEAKKIINKNGSTYKSRTEFLELFPYSLSVIVNRYGSFNTFAEDVNINITNTKKAKYTKQEVDDLILTYLKSGNPIPCSAKKLSNLKLPSSQTILRFYSDWKEPFICFQKMIKIIN